MLGFVRYYARPARLSLSLPLINSRYITIQSEQRCSINRRNPIFTRAEVVLVESVNPAVWSPNYVSLQYTLTFVNTGESCVQKFGIVFSSICDSTLCIAGNQTILRDRRTQMILLRLSGVLKCQSTLIPPAPHAQPLSVVCVEASVSHGSVWCQLGGFYS